MRKNKIYHAIALGVVCSITAGLAVCSAQTPLAGMPPDGMYGAPPAGQAMMQQGKDLASFTAARLLDGETASSSQENILATAADQNTVLLKNGASLIMDGAVLEKTGDTTSGDGSNFNGQNAVFLAADSTAQIMNSRISSAAEGANAIFATGRNAKITAAHVKIHTTQNSSRGLDATYNGTIIAEDMEIVTEGAHCAALATDRGEGTVTVRDSTLSTAGEGSPCIYSTGNISLSKSKGTASGSEIAVVEGKNSIALENVVLTGAVKHGIMLYQSFSGDADTGTASFRAKDSVLTTTSDGPMFYVTNTKAEAMVENTELRFNSNVLIDVTSDRWGSEGSNGGDFTFVGIRQNLKGDIKANAISSVCLQLKEHSVWQGAMNQENTARRAGITLDKTSIWDVSADSYVGDFVDEDASLQNIRSNGHKIYYQSDAQANAWLQGRTMKLDHGGLLLPAK